MAVRIRQDRIMRPLLQGSRGRARRGGTYSDDRGSSCRSFRDGRAADQGSASDGDSRPRPSRRGGGRRYARTWRGLSSLVMRGSSLVERAGGAVDMDRQLLLAEAAADKRRRYAGVIPLPWSCVSTTRSGESWGGDDGVFGGCVSESFFVPGPLRSPGLRHADEPGDPGRKRHAVSRETSFFEFDRGASQCRAAQGDTDIVGHGRPSEDEPVIERPYLRLEWNAAPKGVDVSRETIREDIGE